MNGKPATRLKLDFELALESEALIAKARAMAQANSSMRDPSASRQTLPNVETIDVPPSAERT